MKKFGVVILFLSVVQLFGQQEALYTHYSFNTIAVNPAYAGSRDALTVTGLNRTQWVSFPGAPKTQSLTLHAPFFNEKLAFGLSFLNDKIGPTNTTGIFIDAAYKIRLGYKGSFSFGLKGGLNLRKVDLSGITTNQPGDPNFLGSVTNQALPNFGFGLYYSLPNFYAGISTPRLLQNKFNTDPENTSPDLGKETPHLYIITGTVYELSKPLSLKLKPSAMIKITGGAPIQIDLTALVYYRDFLWAGPMFRTGDAVGVLAGVNITNQFALGYSFDWSFINGTGRYNGGSHEIMMRYDFIFKDKGKIESPRNF